MSQVLSGSGARSARDFVVRCLGDSRESEIERWNGYTRGDHNLTGTGENSPQIAMAEKHATGSARYYLSPLWPILNGKPMGATLVASHLAKWLPESEGCVQVDGPELRPADAIGRFAPWLSPGFEIDCSFDVLEVLVLLGAWARLSADQPLTQSIGALYRRAKPELQKLPELQGEYAVLLGFVDEHMPAAAEPVEYVEIVNAPSEMQASIEVEVGGAGWRENLLRGFCLAVPLALISVLAFFQPSRSIDLLVILVGIVLSAAAAIDVRVLRYRGSRWGA